ncbi:MAG TPA: glycosyltransferase family 9 protein [Bacteroidales bacterium]|nr:glycosyltransferase family 9 protein [Bacteroidales bacterium]
MKLLVIRTSAMGDVALTAPVLSAMRSQYPEVEIVMLTRKAFNPFFSSIDGLEFFFPDFQNRHKGLPGLIRLFRDIKEKHSIDRVIDLHDILRSKVLRFLFMLTDKRVYVIDKGRSDKRKLVSGRQKIKLKHTVERYCDVFARAGYDLNPYLPEPIHSTPEARIKAESLIDKNVLNIGVAPFAKHSLKIWPEQNMIRLLHLIAEQHRCKFWLFGGFEDTERMNSFSSRLPGSFNVIGKMSLNEELALLGKLDLMIAMDSSNMHMAALSGTKVISIWGGTDPLAGFGAWKQPDNYAIRISIDDLKCRPCTVYGRGECLRGDFACMMWLTPELVFRRMQELEVI